MRGTGAFWKRKEEHSGEDLRHDFHFGGFFGMKRKKAVRASIILAEMWT
jgi:hypothetical protein